MPTTVLGLTCISRLMAVAVIGPLEITVRRHISCGAVIWLTADNWRECSAIERVMRRRARNMRRSYCCEGSVFAASVMVEVG
ncbi:hypothetical protein D3C85_632790 [compost metagenome]